MADTGLHSPSANGEDYTGWTDPTYAYSSDDSRAEPAASTNQHDWYNFSLGVPGAVTSIDGIEVICEFRANATGGGARIIVELSWDGGPNYTSQGAYLEETGVTDVSHTQGGAADTWGRSWAASEFSDANFRVRCTHDGNRISQLDHIQVRVTYTESARRIFITHA